LIGGAAHVAFKEFSLGCELKQARRHVDMGDKCSNQRTAFAVGWQNVFSYPAPEAAYIALSAGVPGSKLSSEGFHNTTEHWQFSGHCVSASFFC
jgi:hypothetical protein